MYILIISFKVIQRKSNSCNNLILVLKKHKTTEIRVWCMY